MEMLSFTADWELSFAVRSTVVEHWLDVCSQSALKPQVPRIISSLVPGYHHWEISEGSIGTYTPRDPDAWIPLGLSGNDRWMKKVDITLDPQLRGYSVVDGNILRNTDTVKGDKRKSKPQRRDQSLHCDLPAGVFGLDLTQNHIDIKDEVRDQVLELIGPQGQQPVCLTVRCSVTGKNMLVTVQPGHFIVFSATRCWHAGFGGLQGDRLHAMIMPSRLCGQFKEQILEESKHILLATQVKGKDTSNWVFKDTLSKDKRKQ